MAKSSEWTSARKHAFIVSVLRSGTRRWPPKYETLNEAKTEKKTNKKTGRVAQHYLCAICEDDFPAKDVQCDHVQPVVNPQKGFETWDIYIDRLFCEKDNFQILCRECHKVKSLKEKSSRSITHKKQKKAPLHFKESSIQKK